MTPKQFVLAYSQDAKKTEEETGILAKSVLAQAALESGWGKAAPGFNFFGIKDKDGLNGNEQLLVTVEYSKRMNLNFPVIKSVKPVMIRGEKFYKYVIKDYFAAYKTPEESFTAHANFFFKNPRYAKAIQKDNISDPLRFFTEIHKAGYATDPNYVTTLMKIVKMIEKHLV